MRLLPNYPQCLVCGHSNETGLHASFYRKENTVHVECTFQEHHAGYKGIVHGGLISALLDEALGRIVTSITGKMVVTGELTVRFHNSITVGTSIEAEASMDAEQRHPGLFWDASAILYDSQSKKKYASAKGKFFPIPSEKYDEILSTLEIKGSQNNPVTMKDL